MQVGGVPTSTIPWSDQPAPTQRMDSAAFQDILAETGVTPAPTTDPRDVDLETVASNALGVADEEEEKKKREKRKQDEADGVGTSSAAPSAQEQFELAQKWLIRNNSTTQRIQDSLQSAGADATEAATTGAPPVGTTETATAGGNGAEAALKPPASVSFI